jgi:hypothetical protein
VKKSQKSDISDAAGIRRVFEIPAGFLDYAFCLPGTKLMRKPPCMQEEVFTKGGGIHFDVLTSWSYSIWVLAVNYYLASSFFKGHSTVDNVFTAVTPGAEYRSFGASNSLAQKFLLNKDGLSQVLDTWSVLKNVVSCDPVFWPVKSGSWSCVFLDKTFHGKVSADGFSVCPFDCWVDSQKKVMFYPNSGAFPKLDEPDTLGDGRHICIYWVVMVHVPSFSYEQQAHAQTSTVEKMEGLELSGSVGK